MTTAAPPTIVTTIRRIVALSTERRWRWMALIPLALASAAAEATSAAALFGLIKIVEEPASAGSLPVARTLYAWLPSHDDRAVVLTFTVLLVVFYLVKNVLQILQTFANSRLVAEETAGLARRLFTIYVRAPYAFHLRRNSAELIRNVAHSAGVVFRSGMAPAVALLFEIVVMLAIGGVLLVIAPAVTLVTAGLLAGAAAVFLRLSRRAGARWGHRSEQLMHQVLQNLQQTFGAVKEIKLLVASATSPMSSIAPSRGSSGSSIFIRRWPRCRGSSSRPSSSAARW
jgi:ABC-type multidrug transport system fused ATPase/permease subunit